MFSFIKSNPIAKIYVFLFNRRECLTRRAPATDSTLATHHPSVVRPASTVFKIRVILGILRETTATRRRFGYFELLGHDLLSGYAPSLRCENTGLPGRWWRGYRPASFGSGAG